MAALSLKAARNILQRNATLIIPVATAISEDPEGFTEIRSQEFPYQVAVKTASDRTIRLLGVDDPMEAVDIWVLDPPNLDQSIKTGVIATVSGAIEGKIRLTVPIVRPEMVDVFHRIMGVIERG